MTEIISLREKCARCGHAYSFHQKAFTEPCRAMGCKGGPDKTRCQGFVRPEKATSLSQ
jgi:hypothetical protein